MLKLSDSGKDGGFTLLEVMIAFSIIAIVITTLWGLHSQTVLLNLNSQFDTQAPFLAEIRMAQVIENISKHDENEEGDFGEDFTGYAWKSSVSNVESETLGALAEKLKKIEVSVNFNNEEFTYTLTSYQLLQE
jgi:general secretion pathway protein I